MDQRKFEGLTKKITVYGIVQGVGFRPFVFRIAQKHKIHGTVKNAGGFVEIIAQADENALEHFLQDLKSENIKNGYISSLKMVEIEDQKYDEFKIIESGKNGTIYEIPADLTVCGNCLEELYKNDNRRYENPFISCTACGPRYTIIEALPYDRDNTTMRDFRMCPSCKTEYETPQDRRFHAQTISCHDCGPYLLFESEKEKLIKKDAFMKAAEILKAGGIVAVKGIGGYHFCCSPFAKETVLNLRKLKGREEKPFAVMFENVSQVAEFCTPDETAEPAETAGEEIKLLESEERPIVLIASGNKTRKTADPVNGESSYFGAFLPYTPLQMMLIRACGPLIMTSGNLSDNPIIKDDAEMLKLKSPLLDGVLYHKRRILRSVDDSVVKVIENHPQILRRSRGYVPHPIFLKKCNTNTQIFAAGGDLKAAFCLYKDHKAVVSQYFGDLEHEAVLEAYKKSADDLSRLLKITPQLAICDMHPNYHCVKFAKTLGIPVLEVQHHHAHIASVMAEHHLKEKVIGVAFDGTGYGSDGNIWGGEFLVCEGADFTRAAHLTYTPILGGDRSMKDAKKTADCFLINAGLQDYIRDGRTEMIKAALDNRINTVLSSSMGRLFDAVSSILGICHENRYEGKCAIALEKEAQIAFLTHEKPQNLRFTINRENGIIETAGLLEQICLLKDKISIGELALGFHFAVADMILNVCENIKSEHNINTVALSGGVFQNTLLIEKTIKLLKQNGFTVYYNQLVPPNDGAISLGQTYLGCMR